jgi:hypothetical protein
MTWATNRAATGTSTGFGTQSAGTGFGTQALSTSPGFGFGAASTSAFGAASAFGAGRTGTGFRSFTQPKHQARRDDDPTGTFNRVWQLRGAYNPESPGYRFCFVFYNAKQGDDFPARPPNIQESDWIDLCLKMPDPDHFVPAPVNGFDGLEDRHRAQEAICRELEERMRLIHAKLREMTSFYATELRGPFQQVRQKIAEINEELAVVYEIEDVQRRQGAPLTGDERQLLTGLEEIDRTMETQRYRARIDKLRQRLDKGKQGASKRGVGGGMADGIREKVVAALDQNEQGLEALEKVTKELHRIADVWKKEMQKRTPVGSRSP